MIKSTLRYILLISFVLLFKIGVGQSYPYLTVINNDTVVVISMNQVVKLNQKMFELQENKNQIKFYELASIQNDSIIIYLNEIIANKDEQIRTTTEYNSELKERVNKYEAIVTNQGKLLSERRKKLKFFKFTTYILGGLLSVFLITK